MKLSKIVLGTALIIFPLFGEKYYLTSLSYGDKQEAMDNKEAYIEFFDNEKRFGGKSVCNNFIGNWNNRNEIKSVGSTMMMCSEPEMKLERKILVILNNSTIKFENKIVVVANGYGKLVFVAK